jgi:hypothetical protein
MLERCTFRALEKHYQSWVDAAFDMESAIAVRPRMGLCLVRARDGHRRFAITSSYFVAFADETKTTARFRVTQDYWTMLCLLHARGNVTCPELLRQQGILRSFLMGVEGLDGDGDGEKDNDEEDDELFEEEEYHDEDDVDADDVNDDDKEDDVHVIQSGAHTFQSDHIGYRGCAPCHKATFYQLFAEAKA